MALLLCRWGRCIVLWYLLRYVCRKKKVGFPEKALYKVMSELEERNISYEVYGSKKEDKMFSKGRNGYYKIRHQAYENWNLEKKRVKLIEEMEQLNLSGLEEVMKFLESKKL